MRNSVSEQPGNTEPLYPSRVKLGMLTAPSNHQERLSFPEAGAPLLEHHHGARRCPLALCQGTELGAAEGGSRTLGAEMAPNWGKAWEASLPSQLTVWPDSPSHPPPPQGSPLNLDISTHSTYPPHPTRGILRNPQKPEEF